MKAKKWKQLVLKRIKSIKRTKNTKGKKRVRQKKRKDRPRRIARTVLAGVLKKSWLMAAGLVLIAGIGLAGLFYLFRDLPSPTTLESGTFPVSTKIFDRNDTLLYEIYTDQNRTPIELKELPDHVKWATIATEDKDFYKHGGFAYRGIIRAFYKTLFKKELQGGSTITQQLVKTALLTPERTLKRKVREAFLAWLTEIIYSKDQILEMYLNHAPYGGTAYGIEEAAQTYFGKSARDLALEEAALLAGLPQAPTKFSPFGANPEASKDRQKHVLSRMVEDGYIKSQEADEAFEKKLDFAPQKTDIKAPHFVMYIKELLVERYGQRKVEQGGLRVKTTLDLELQEYTQATVAAEIKKLESANVSNGAALITKPPTGEVLAMIGSKDYFDQEIDGNVNVTTRLRQPGSSIKPVNYALGLLKGYTAATVFLDMPTCFQVPGQPLYCPKNYDGVFHSLTYMRAALGNSFNIPAVKMLALNGVTDMIELARKMGITTWQDPSHYGLSLTLGGGEVQMTQMAVAFGVFANQGVKIELNPILEVKDYTGQVLEKLDLENAPPAGKRVIPAEVAFIISHILLDNGARTTAFGASSQLVIPGKTVSVKTGTTDDFRDNWTIGFTPSFLTVVWTGNNDNTPMHPYLVSGITGAAPIWNKLMTKVLDEQPDEFPKKPQDIVGQNVCLFKQNLDNPESSSCRFEYFIKGTEKNPLNAIIEKKNIWIDKETGRPPEEGKAENLELQEKIVISDAFVTDYCLNCPHEDEKPTVINMEAFAEKLEQFLVTLEQKSTSPPDQTND